METQKTRPGRAKGVLDGVEESKGKDKAIVVDDYENMFQGGVALETCDEELAERVSVTGNYDEHDCGLQMTGMVEEDGGIWECEVAGKYPGIFAKIFYFRWRNTSLVTLYLEPGTARTLLSVFITDLPQIFLFW